MSVVHERIQSLISSAETELARLKDRRDRSEQYDRERYGIDCLAWAIRIKAFKECLAIAQDCEESSIPDS